MSDLTYEEAVRLGYVEKEEDKTQEIPTPIQDETLNYEDATALGYIEVPEKIKEKELDAPDIATEYMFGIMSKTSDKTTQAANVKKIANKRGYSLVDFKDTEDGTIYTLEDESGVQYKYDEGSFRSSLLNVVGDIPEYVGGALGLALGKTPTSSAAGAVAGQSIGNVINQLFSYALTGEELSAGQRGIEVGKAAGEAILEITGQKAVSVVGGLTLGRKEAIKKVSKLVDFTNIENPRLSADVLESLSDDGYTLLKSDLFDETSAQQLLAEMARNPRTSDIVADMSQKNKEALVGQIRKMTKVADADKSTLVSAIRQSAGEIKAISPVGYGVQKGLKSRDTVLEQNYTILYNAMEKLDDGSVVGDADKLASSLGSLIAKGSPNELSTLPATKTLVNNIKADISGRKLTPTKLLSRINTYKKMMNSDDPTDKAVYSAVIDILEKELDSVANMLPTGSKYAETLKEARGIVKQRYTTFGKKTTLYDLANRESTESIITDILDAKDPVANAVKIRTELMSIEGGDKILKDLSGQIVSDAMKPIEGMLKSDVKISTLLDALNTIDIPVLEKLSGKKFASEVNTIKELVKRVAHHEVDPKAGGLATSGYIKSFFLNPYDTLKDWFTKRQLAKTITDRTANKNLIKALREFDTVGNPTSIAKARARAEVYLKAGDKEVAKNALKIAEQKAQKKHQSAMKKLSDDIVKAKGEEKAKLIKQANLFFKKVPSKATKGKQGESTGRTLMEGLQPKKQKPAQPQRETGLKYGLKDGVQGIQDIPATTKHKADLKQARQKANLSLSKTTGKKPQTGKYESDSMLNKFLTDIAHPESPINHEYVKRMEDVLKEEGKSVYGFSTDKKEAYNKLRAIVGKLRRWKTIPESQKKVVEDAISNYLNKTK